MHSQVWVVQYLDIDDTYLEGIAASEDAAIRCLQLRGPEWEFERMAPDHGTIVVIDRRMSRHAKPRELQTETWLLCPYEVRS